jgi:hypothetical protein
MENTCGIEMYIGLESAVCRFQNPCIASSSFFHHFFFVKIFCSMDDVHHQLLIGNKS